MLCIDLYHILTLNNGIILPHDITTIYILPEFIACFFDNHIHLRAFPKMSGISFNLFCVLYVEYEPLNVNNKRFVILFYTKKKILVCITMYNCGVGA